jgi:thiol-disulfide isomerase/thioredoxin
MSDIPSALSKWEPPQWIKASFLVTVVISFALLFGAKIYTNVVINPLKVEEALQAVRLTGPAPKFTLKDQTGHDVSLDSFKGRLVFVNFWATWCAPCREEMPSLIELSRQMRSDDVVFLTVSVDDGWEVVVGFAQQAQLELPPSLTLLDADKKVSASYGTTVYPESYLIGRDGQLLYKFVGARDWDAIAATKILENAGARRLPPRDARAL